MLKIIREGAIERPWVYRTFMIVIATLFVLTMGWWGFEQSREDTMITVGSDRVSRDEYLRAEQNISRFYREITQGSIPEDKIKEQAVNQLISYHLWLQAANEMGVTVTEDEMRDAIMKNQAFQANGKFDPVLYKRLLAQIKATPDRFESSQRAELMVQKAQMLVRESVSPTPIELIQAQVAMAMKPTPTPAVPMEPMANPEERARQMALAQKQQLAVKAYEEALKAKTKISVRREMM